MADIPASYNLSLMITTTILVVTLIFAFIFGQAWRKQKRSQNEQYLPFALMLLYLFLFVSSVMTCYSNFFADPSVLLFLKTTKFYFISVVGFIVIVASILIFIAERIIRKNTKHLFLIYFIITIALFIFFRIFDIAIFRGFFFIVSIPLAVLFALFIYKLVWKTSGQLRQKMIIVVIGSTVFILILIYEIILLLVGEVVQLFENKGIILIASILIGYGFYTIPSFTEFDWDKKIRQLYILNLNGLCVLQQPFKKQSIDEDMLGGALTAVQSLMKEMIQSDKFLEVIDHGDAKIIFERTPYAIGIIIADENLYILHYKLQQLLREFDLLFGPIMKDWTGNLDIFKPFRFNVNKIFEIKSEKS
jgi:hypothetical protein